MCDVLYTVVCSCNHWCTDLWCVLSWDVWLGYRGSFTHSQVLGQSDDWVICMWMNGFICLIILICCVMLVTVSNGSFWLYLRWRLDSFLSCSTQRRSTWVPRLSRRPVCLAPGSALAHTMSLSRLHWWVMFPTSSSYLVRGTAFQWLVSTGDLLVYHCSSLFEGEGV